MAYSWGGAAKPAGAFDTQLWVDQSRVVWQWNDVAKIWVRRSGFQTRQVEAATLGISGMPTSLSVFSRRTEMLLTTKPLPKLNLSEELSPAK